MVWVLSLGSYFFSPLVRSVCLSFGRALVFFRHFVVSSCTSLVRYLFSCFFRSVARPLLPTVFSSVGLSFFIDVYMSGVLAFFMRCVIYVCVCSYFWSYCIQ